MEILRRYISELNWVHLVHLKAELFYSLVMSPLYLDLCINVSSETAGILGVVFVRWQMPKHAKNLPLLKEKKKMLS